jgi:FkbM family methyltransferase
MLIPFDYLFQKYKIKAPGVLHIGAHFGEEALVYQSQGIARAIWIEALPAAYRRLVVNVARLPRLASTCLNACVSDVDDKSIIFHVASNEGQSSSFLEFGTHAIEHPTVKFTCDLPMKTTRVASLLKERELEVGPGWFLNVDLQGAELLALKGMGGLLHQFDYAYIEVNAKELYKGCPLVSQIDNYLAGYGFVGMETKMTGSGWGDKFYQKLMT